MVAAAMHAVVLLGYVGKRQEMRARARDGQRRRHGHVAQQPIDVLELAVERACLLVAALAHLLDPFKNLVAFVMPQHTAQHFPEQAHVITQRLVWIGRPSRSVPIRTDSKIDMNVGDQSPSRLRSASLPAGRRDMLVCFWRVGLKMHGGRRRCFADSAAQRESARNPGPAENLDLAAGPGGHDGAPTAPFTFVEEHGTGAFPASPFATFAATCGVRSGVTRCIPKHSQLAWRGRPAISSK